MAQYFFLASSLPALQFGNAMPITLADFHDRCASAMPQDEFELLKRTELLPGDISGFCSNDLTVKFWIWETILRNALLPLRANGNDYSQFLREEKDAFAEIQALVSSVNSAPNPMEAEKFLDSARWECIDRILGPDSFSFNALCAYKLQLLLLEKYNARTPERGEQHLDAILQQLQRESTQNENQ